MIRAFFSGLHFEAPWMFALLLVLPAVYLIYLRRQKQNGVKYAYLPGVPRMGSWRLYLLHLPSWLTIGALICLIFALAKPVRYQPIKKWSGNGIDIILCMDVSGSMLATDFLPNRLQASQNVAASFVEKRSGDRIGLVIFAAQSLGLCPLTTDHQALLSQLQSLHYGWLADGTAIGSGLASSIERLRASQSAAKVVILLTDGNNTGGIDPQYSVDLAKSHHIRVYTIGVGRQGLADMPYQTSEGTEYKKETVTIDEALLQKIAAETGGAYFGADNLKGLEMIYSEIDKMEKSKIEVQIFSKRINEFMPFVKWSLVLVLIELLVSSFLLRKLF